MHLVVETAVEIRDALLEAYDLPFEEGGVDELHIVYTEFKSMVFRNPRSCACCPSTWVTQRLWARKSFPTRN